MSSLTVMNRIGDFFPEGIMMDGGGNCFLMAIEFPTIDGRMASVQMWEEGVLFYHRDGQVLSKEDWVKLVENDEEEVTVAEYEHFIYNAETIFSVDDINYDDDGNETGYGFHADYSHFFDNNTMIEIGKTWSKFNICMDRAFRGE